MKKQKTQNHKKKFSKISKEIRNKNKMQKIDELKEFEKLKI